MDRTLESWGIKQWAENKDRYRVPYHFDGELDADSNYYADFAIFTASYSVSLRTTQINNLMDERILIHILLLYIIMPVRCLNSVHEKGVFRILRSIWIRWAELLQFLCKSVSGSATDTNPSETTNRLGAKKTTAVIRFSSLITVRSLASLQLPLSCTLFIMDICRAFRNWLPKQGPFYEAVLSERSIQNLQA